MSAQNNVDGFILDRIGQKHMLSLLAEIPGVLADLQVTLSRQDQHAKGPSISRGNNAQPLPFAIHASDAHEALHTELAHWARLACRARKVGLPDRVDPLNLAVWLRLNVIHLAFTPHSDTAPGRLQHAIRKCRQACDSPPQTTALLGHCAECKEPVRKYPEDNNWTCKCGAELNPHEVWRDIDHGIAELILDAKDTANLINLRYNTNIKPKTVYDMSLRKLEPIEPIRLDNGKLEFHVLQVVEDLRIRGKIK